jgi:hypothetical protein
MGTKKILLGIIAIVILISGIGFYFYLGHKAIKEEERLYISRVNLVRDEMVFGAVTMSLSLDKVRKVWADAIDDGSDFNSLIFSLYLEDDFSEDIKNLEEKNTEIDRLMGLISDVPERYKDLNEDVEDYYDAYQSLNNLTTSPSGSLLTFNSEVNERKDAFIVIHKRLLIKVPYKVYKESGEENMIGDLREIEELTNELMRESLDNNY